MSELEELTETRDQLRAKLDALAATDLVLADAAARGAARLSGYNRATTVQMIECSLSAEGLEYFRQRLAHYIAEATGQVSPATHLKLVK